MNLTRVRTLATHDTGRSKLGTDLLLVLVAVAAIIMLLVVARPFTRDGFPSGHDATAHLTYTFLFDRALGQGQFPVRWVEWVQSGEGQPLFNFYPPGLYYLIEAVHLVVPRLSTALESSVVLVWWFGAAFTFLWLRPLGWVAAALAAVLFAWSPYVIVDVFVRAAYPELAAMALAPGLLWSIDRLRRGGRGVDALVVACFVGAMLLCHLLSSLIFAPVIAAYAVHRLATGPGAARKLALLAGGGLIGVGLAAFYVLPSMAELDHVAIGRMTSGYSAYQQHFVAPSQWLSRAWGYGASVTGGDDGIPFQIDLVQWIAIGLASTQLARVAVARRRVPHAAQLAFWLVAVVAAMFLMTERSAWLWRVLPALSYLQFPWRYFMVVSLGAAALAGLLVASLPSRAAQAVIAIGIIVWLHDAHRGHLRPLQYYLRQAINIDNPRWPEVEPQGIGAFIERGFTPIAARSEAPRDNGRWTILDGSGDVRVRRLADDSLDLEVATTTGMRLQINSHAFPGWLVLIDSQPAEVAVDPRNGYQQVTMSAGTHRVEARFTNTPVRTAANAITIVSASVWMVAFLYASFVYVRNAKFPNAPSRYVRTRDATRRRAAAPRD